MGYGFGNRIALGRRAITAQAQAEPAPSGIPVASTNTINVVDTFNIGQTISLTKISSTEYRTENYSFDMGQIYCGAYSDNVYITGYRVSVILENGYWIYRYYGIYNCEENYEINQDNASVQQITNGIIPQTGWSPALTITAAPSGIPISTETITVLTVGATSAASEGPYNKQSDTEWWAGSDYYLRYDGTWYFQNEDTGSTSYHPAGTNPNFIPDTGWNNGITITSA